MSDATHQELPCRKFERRLRDYQQWKRQPREPVDEEDAGRELEFAWGEAWSLGYEAALSAARVEEMLAKAQALVDKLDECEPHITNLSAMQFVRSGVQYSGPQYGEALEELRAVLTTSPMLGLDP